jgi:hypothetical protein
MEGKFSQERVNRIMESLGGMQPAAAHDFFYTRLKGKMQPATEKKTILNLRPAFITAALSLFLIVNVFSLISINKKPKQHFFEEHSNPSTIESFAKAYNLNTSESDYE